MAHPRKQTSLAAAAVAIPFSQKLVLAIKAYLKNDVLDRRPSFDQEEDLSQIRLQSVEMTSDLGGVFKLSAEYLHSQQRKYEYEEEQDHEEGVYG